MCFTIREPHTQVILALQRLVLALGSDSPKTYSVLLPALQYATDPAAPEALALLEDGLDTLLAALRCAPEPALGLTALFPHLTAAMAQSTGEPPPSLMSQRPLTEEPLHLATHSKC